MSRVTMNGRALNIRKGRSPRKRRPGQHARGYNKAVMDAIEGVQHALAAVQCFGRACGLAPAFTSPISSGAWTKETKDQGMGRAGHSGRRNVPKSTNAKNQFYARPAMPDGDGGETKYETRCDVPVKYKLAIVLPSPRHAIHVQDWTGTVINDRCRVTIRTT